MKIGLCGSMSVGKTTLVNTLAELPQFKDFTFATERSKYLRDLGIPLNTDSTLKGQTVFLAERCAELINENLITDRTIIDVMAFTQNSKSIDYVDKERFKNYSSDFIREYDYIFYISPDGVDIEDNGIRTIDPEYRDLIDFTIRHFIKVYGHKLQNCIQIKGSTDERIKQILETISL